MPGWEITLWGHTLALGVLVPLVVFPAVLVVIGVYPFVEAWVTGDRREHHLLDRPRNRPVRTGLGVAWLTFFLVALVGGGNDLWATRFHVSLNAVTWFVRVALVVGPVITFVITRRICLGLQRRDRELVLHGRESGRIKRLPHGEYVEIHEPLTQDRLHTLTAHEQPPALESGPETDVNGVRRRIPRAERLRVRLSRGLHGEGAQVPKPTAREYEEAQREHR